MGRNRCVVGLLAMVGLAGCPPPSNLVPVPKLAPLDQSTTQALVEGVQAGAGLSIWDSGGRLVGLAIGAGTRTRVALVRPLVPGELLVAVQTVAGRNSHASPPVRVELNYPTYHFDRYRTGWNPYERQLTVATAPNLRLIARLAVDGPVRAQPLYVERVAVPHGTPRDALIVATENDTVYAFDVRMANPSALLWPPRRLVSGTEVPADFNNVGGCDAQLGVSATPVIDRTTNTLYVTALLQRTAGSSAPLLFRLHALDLATGKDQPGSPVEITGATVSLTNAAGAPVPFNPKWLGNRPGLLLNRGVLYVAFGSHCYDAGDYFGWVLAYDADLPGTPAFLRQLGVFNTAPDLPVIGSTGSGQERAGIWQSGFGLAGDEQGHAYLVTGNGSFGGSAYGNSVLKLAPPPFTGGAIRRADSFTPFNWAHYNTSDQDFGSGGAMLIPVDPVGGKRTLIAAGKRGTAYLMDRDAMGGHVSAAPDAVLQTVDLVPTPATDVVAGGPAYYRGPSGPVVFFGIGRAQMQAYRVQANNLLALPPIKSSITMPSTSPIPVVSSNGSTAGTGVVWVVSHPGSMTGTMLLQAFEAENVNAPPLLGTGLKAGSWVPVPMHFGGNSFQVPTVIHGRVYTGGKDEVRIWGL